VNYFVLIQDQVYSIEIIDDGEKQNILWDGKRVDLAYNLGQSNSSASLILNGRPFEVAVKQKEDAFTVYLDQREYRVGVTRGGKQADKTALIQHTVGQEIISAPMPGMVVDLKIAKGQSVEMGTPLLILEAMKMENELRSPVNGRVKEIHAQPGKKVEKGEKLIVLEK
jgi:biotin carboxyl carrier protein